MPGGGMGSDLTPQPKKKSEKEKSKMEMKLKFKTKTYTQNIVSDITPNKPTGHKSF